MKEAITAYLDSFRTLCPGVTPADLDYLVSGLTVSHLKARHFYLHANTVQLKRSMRILSGKQVCQVDRAVMMEAEDATYLVRELKVKALALRGEEDFVPTPPEIETIAAKGGHVSSLEAPLEVSSLVGRLMALAISPK